MPLLALDAGTTSTRAMIFGDDGSVLSQSQKAFTQHFPSDGWVEHDAEEIYEATVTCAREAIAAADLKAADIGGIGIAVQRETVVVWDKGTGKPIHRAIVWQDRRTAGTCEKLAQDPKNVALVARTGLLLDAYFSATKIAWILDNVPGARDAAERGELKAGTIDTWLLWKLTNGDVHATDATNASRTLLFDIHRREWSDELCALFRVPRTLLAEVHDSASDYGETSADIFGAPIRIRALLGDQQAGALGQNCLAAGEAKATYGTGCFVLVHTGDAPVASKNRLLATIALQVGGHTTYALEGSIFNAGTVVQWLRDRMGLITSADETAAIAASIETSGGTYCVPAFTGLGAPWWAPHARAALVGMTRDTGRAQVVRAALESVAYQTRDLASAFADDGVPIRALRVDGGMSANDWLMQCVADQVGCEVERPPILETTAWGVARLAGIHAGIYPGLKEAPRQRVERSFVPGQRDEKGYAGWLTAVRSVLPASPPEG